LPPTKNTIFGARIKATAMLPWYLQWSIFYYILDLKTVLASLVGGAYFR